MRVASVGKLILVMVLFVSVVSGCAERQSSESDGSRTTNDNHDKDRDTRTDKDD